MTQTYQSQTNEQATSVCEIKTGEPLKILPSDEALARLTKALSHPIRVALIRHLLQLGECVCTDLSELVPVAHSTAMQHIKVLKEADLLCSTQQGRNVFYCVNPAALAQLKQLVGAL